MNSTEQLSEMLANVADEKSFLRFVEALIADRERAAKAEKENWSSGAGYRRMATGGWQNTSIESFLECAAAWAADSDFGLEQGLVESNPWRRFAAFLYAGKIYE